ncbi:MAG: crossover junction endodeoxyribonuclease RuvC [Pacificimonas sp.]|jgi:crossover junction endodeoxyribonuclease RuvC|nr:crossover junction endodeoxyribonuclease RuvC [Pacificimonas sp.]
MIVIGLDPSLTATGWGVIHAEGSRLRHIASGTIKPGASLPMPARLAMLFSEVRAVLTEHRPDTAGMEEVFANRNPQSTLKLGQARGAVMAALGDSGIPCAEYAARSIKKGLTGTGSADKTQVRAMVERLLPGAKPDSLDASDALAVAITRATMLGREKLVMQA